MTNSRSFVHVLLASLAAAALTACGGGDGTVQQTSTGFTVDAGLAQKGPLVRGSSVRINELNPLNYMPAGTTYDVSTNDNLGGFSLKGINFTRQHLEITAQGYYFNELTGAPADDFITLQAQADLTLDRLVNVNTLTDLANARTKALVTRTTSPMQFAAARAQAQREVLAAFYIYNSADLMPGGVDGTGLLVPGNFSELDISKTAAANQILAAVSSLSVSAGVNGVGISTFLANFEADLADDGLINNSPGITETVRSQIDKAAAAVNFSTVATNLNGFYKSTGYVGNNMLQWVDSSGGGDRVINRYKFTGTGVIGTRSQSPAYTAGSDDIGQCMSVSAGTLYVGGVATTAKTVKVAAGNTFSIGLLPTVAGSLTGYIQRSAPTAGACPSAVPDKGLTRVVKYSLQTTASIGGTITGLGTGKSITLTNNGDDALTRTEDGAFTFATKLAVGAAYSVAVSSQPGGQTCAVASATGTATTNVTNIDITCASSTQKPASLLILDGLTDGSINRAPLTFYGTATTKTVKDPL